jgi:hypothetical protein
MAGVLSEDARDGYDLHASNCSKERADPPDEANSARASANDGGAAGPLYVRPTRERLQPWQFAQRLSTSDEE